MKMFQGALGEVLPLGNALGFQVTLDQGDRDASLSEFNGESDSDRPAADDRHSRRSHVRARHIQLNACRW